MGANTLDPERTPRRARAVHYCYHVLNLEASLVFYRDALDLVPVRRVEHADGSCIVFVENGEAGFQLELTWDPARTEPTPVPELMPTCALR